jgi:hypothetical protein
MLWAGMLALAANTFLFQELVRIYLDHMDRVSAGDAVFLTGYMQLSSGAWPATWVYWASHVWVVYAIRQVRSTPHGSSRGKAHAFLAAIVLLEIVIIHPLVLMLRGSWHLRPTLLW